MDRCFFAQAANFIDNVLQVVLDVLDLASQEKQAEGRVLGSHLDHLFHELVVLNIARPVFIQNSEEGCHVFPFHVHEPHLLLKFRKAIVSRQQLVQR